MTAGLPEAIALISEISVMMETGKMPAAVYGDRWRSWLAFSSYKLTCGQGNTWGDGITPIAAAHLSGAENLVLDGAMHSPRGDRVWYGSPGLLEQWIPYLEW